MIFGQGPDSRNRAALAQLLLGKKWGGVLAALSARHGSAVGAVNEMADVSLVRVLEEKGDITALAQLLIDKEFRAIFALRNREPETAEARGFTTYLDRVFEEHNARGEVLGEEVWYQVGLLKKIRQLAQLFVVQKNLTESYRFIDRNPELLDVTFASLENKVKLAYLELVTLELQVLIDYNNYLRSSTFKFSFDNFRNSIKPKIDQLHTFYYRNIRNCEVSAEEPVASLEDICNKIDQLFAIITTVS